MRQSMFHEKQSDDQADTVLHSQILLQAFDEMADEADQYILALATSNASNSNNNSDTSDLSPLSTPQHTIPVTENNIPESTAYWSKEPYAWSTSLDYTPPLLTSSLCAQSIYDLFHNSYYDYNSVHGSTLLPLEQPNGLLAVVTESSSHPTGLQSVLAQPWMYAGPGLGNIDECPLQTCLAGSRSTDSLTFAAVCVVPECSAYDLAAEDFVSTVARQLDHAMMDLLEDHNNHNNNNVNNINSLEVMGREYVTLLERIHELNKFLGTGWTCGSFVVPFCPWPWGIPFVGALAVFVVLAIARMLQKIFQQRNAPQHTTSSKTVVEAAESSSLMCGFFQQKSTDEDTTLTTTDSEETLALVTGQHPTSNSNDYTPRIVSTNTNNVDEFFTPTVSQFGYAFDVSKHLQQIMGTSLPVDQTQQHRATACLDGLRVGSLAWIMLGHVMAIQSSRGAGYSNPANFLPPTGLTTTVPGQLLFASRLAVDTFLCLSGFLVVHIMYKKLPLPLPRKEPWTQSHPLSFQHTVVGRYFFHAPTLLLSRVVRILPMYAVCLGFYTHIAPQMGGGPFWHQWIDLLKPCHDYGWTNLLFINNFYPFDTPTINTCFYHSWYLAVDMQLYVLAPILVFWFQYNPKQGIIVTLSLLLASAGTTMYLAWIRRWSANTFDGAAVYRYDMEAYAKPHVRAQAYLAGMFVAMWLLWRKEQDSIVPSRYHARFAWHGLAMFFALLGMSITTFGTAWGAYARRPCQYTEDPLQGDDCGSTWGRFGTWMYTGMSQSLWSTCVAVILYISLRSGMDSGTSRSNLVVSILSWRCWTPLAQLSFGAYLIHPIVIYVWQLGSREKQTFRLLSFGMDYLSVCVVSYVAALLAAVLVEYPCATLWRNYVTLKYLRGNQCTNHVKTNKKQSRKYTDEEVTQHDLQQVHGMYGSVQNGRRQTDIA